MLPRLPEHSSTHWLTETISFAGRRQGRLVKPVRPRRINRCRPLPSCFSIMILMWPSLPLHLTLRPGIPPGRPDFGRGSQGNRCRDADRRSVHFGEHRSRCLPALLEPDCGAPFARRSRSPESRRDRRRIRYRGGPRRIHPPRTPQQPPPGSPPRTAEALLNILPTEK